MKTGAGKSNNEILTSAQRGAELFVAAGMLLLAGFFAYHQLTNTGFFTDKFGKMEMISLYGPVVVSLSAPIVRAVTGRRNPARPFEVAMNLSLAAGSFWLWIVFPFNFAHLGDIFPDVVRFVTSWITDDVGKTLLLLQVIIGPIAALVTILKYFSVQRQTISA